MNKNQINNNLLIDQNDKIINAINKINENSKNGVFVIDENKKLVGILTDADLRKANLLDYNINDKIKKIMQKKPFYLYRDRETKTDLLAILSIKLLVPIVDQDHKVVGHHHILDFTINNKDNFSSKNKNKNILVIGGAGYAGSEIVKSLIENNFNVTVFDRLMYENCFILHKSSKSNYNFIYGNTLELDKLEIALASIDCVIHLAEIVGDPATSINKNFTVENNYTSTENIIKCCIKMKIKKYIYFSSCSVYGHSPNYVSEESSLNPLSLYARCKIASENAIENLSQFNDIDIVIFRLATLHGRSFRQRFDLVVNKLIIESLSKNEISIDGGDQWRPFLSLKDLSKVTEFFINANLLKRFNIYNIGSDSENYTINDIAKILKNNFKSLKVNYLNNISDQRDYKVNFDKLKNEINFDLKNNIHDTIKDLKTSFDQKIFYDHEHKKYSNFSSLIME